MKIIVQLTLLTHHWHFDIVTGRTYTKLRPVSFGLVSSPYHNN